MRGPDGGSLPDPQAARPDQMWRRSPALTDMLCKACHADPALSKTRPFKHRVYAETGPKPGLYLICVRCDGGTQSGM